MLRWALVFFVFSLLAAVFGFGGLAATTGHVAQILFYTFIGLFILTLLMGIARKGDNLIKKDL